MYSRFKVWQNPIISSQSESVWENEIVLDIDSVDVRFKLKGYGWKPNASDENLVVLYEGRYSCYYREVGAGTWILFTKVISERATYSDSTVYADTFVELGIVDEK